MPLEEFSCHCEIVYDEIIEALEKMLSKSKPDKRVIAALESQLLDLNKLVTYMHNCLQVYNNRKRSEHIVIHSDNDHLDWKATLVEQLKQPELPEISEQPETQLDQEIVDATEIQVDQPVVFGTGINLGRLNSDSTDGGGDELSNKPRPQYLTNTDPNYNTFGFENPRASSVTVVNRGFDNARASLATVMTQNRGGLQQTIYQDFGHERIQLEDGDDVNQDSEMVDTHAEFEVDTAMTNHDNPFIAQVSNEQKTLQTPSFPSSKKLGEPIVSEFQ